MAEIKPLRPWRYTEKAGPIQDLISPLFDVVDPLERRALYKKNFNSIHISVPEKDPESAAALLTEWKNNKIIAQDYLPAIYVYYQYFKQGTSDHLHCQKGFICNIRLHAWSEQQILKHEAVVPSSLHGRIEILQSLEMNLSPTHGLYSDPEHQLEKFMDESMLAPLYEVMDQNGVLNKLSMIHDKKVIEVFMAVLKTKPVILADGHHRFNASMAYQKQKAEKQSFNRTEAWNYHCMYLSNTEANEIKILPTHRLIDPIENFDKNAFLTKISTYFELKPLETVKSIDAEIASEKWQFGLILKDEQFALKLKKGMESAIHWNFPQEIKELDLTIMHYFIISKCLNIHEKDQKNSKNINFSHNFTKCIEAVRDNKAQMALITREISINQVKKVCYSGFTFPQKSTYFYPKVICGFLFSSVKQEDFITEIDSCIKFKQV
ncbi:MAG: DUF1015 domain-containing protein [Cytophagaceae bacterium]